MDGPHRGASQLDGCSNPAQTVRRGPECSGAVAGGAASLAMHDARGTTQTSGQRPDAHPERTSDGANTVSPQGRAVLGLAMETTLSRRTLLAGLALPIARPIARPMPVPSLVPLVVLDPGHGGKDPGAIGGRGTYEKHVVFAIAQELQRQLTATRRCTVALTRRRDVFIPLPDRVAFAQARGAALFVSLHADALADPAVRGASVYTLATTASDAQTAALALRENSADRFDPRLRGLPREVTGILDSLIRRETRVGSARMAARLVGALDRAAPLLTNPLRHAGFAVLRAADVPSVLVELGFLSNLQDEAALGRPQHRQHLAAAVRGAIEQFLANGSAAV